jgi:hypothetical protein
MKSVRVHAVLLVAGLLVAFTTWVRDDVPANRDASAVIWERKPSAIAGVVYQSGPRTIELERRGAGNAAYVWGKETSPEPAAPAAAGAAQIGARDSTQAAARDSAARDSTQAAARDSAAPRLRTDEFPTGQNTDALLEGLATLRVVRDLGSADSTKQAAYGLTTSDARLTIRFQDDTERVLLLGSRVVGGADRYALDTGANRIYVLSSNLIRPLDAGAAELRLTEFHDFNANQVAAVSVRAQGGERRMLRRAGNANAPPSWITPGSEQTDQAFGNFMQQLGQLWINRYQPSMSTDSLEAVLRIEYFDDDADSLGLLELYRTRGAAGSTRVYYLRTPRTIVPGEVYGPLGERIEQDIATLFRAGAPASRS